MSKMSNLKKGQNIIKNYQQLKKIQQFQQIPKSPNPQIAKFPNQTNPIETRSTDPITLLPHPDHGW